MWAGMTGTHLSGSWFSVGSVNGAMYEDMQVQVTEAGTAETVWFQQDRPPTHFPLSVRVYPNDIFLHQCIWSSISIFTCSSSLAITQYRPDNLDNTLWNFIIKTVAVKHYGTTEELKDAVTMAFQLAPPQMLEDMFKWMWQCIQ